MNNKIFLTMIQIHMKLAKVHDIVSPSVLAGFLAFLMY